jgi:hypothetical protein
MNLKALLCNSFASNISYRVVLVPVMLLWNIPAFSMDAAAFLAANEADQ